MPVSVSSRFPACITLPSRSRSDSLGLTLFISVYPSACITSRAVMPSSGPASSTASIFSFLVGMSTFARLSRRHRALIAPFAPIFRHLHFSRFFLHIFACAANLTLCHAQRLFFPGPQRVHLAVHFQLHHIHRGVKQQAHTCGIAGPALCYLHCTAHHVQHFFMFFCHVLHLFSLACRACPLACSTLPQACPVGSLFQDSSGRRACTCCCFPSSASIRSPGTRLLHFASPYQPHDSSQPRKHKQRRHPSRRASVYHAAQRRNHKYNRRHKAKILQKFHAPRLFFLPLLAYGCQVICKQYKVARFIYAVPFALYFPDRPICIGFSLVHA
nr:MAG TPA: hypothetical protein [Caudoviricetes sp.]